MTTHEHERVIGVLREDPRWDRKIHDSLWGQGWLDGYYGNMHLTRYFDSNNAQFVRVTDPAEVEEYRQGYRAGQDKKAMS